jgi:ADP-heptose:LPS heptosyltransferase
VKQKKALIFFSAGLGDAVLLLPLIKHLKNKGFQVTGFFNSSAPCEDVFSRISLLDKIITGKNKLIQLKFSLVNFSKYDKAYINYFAAKRINLLTAWLCSKEIITNRKIDSFFYKLFQSKINYIAPLSHLHDAEQNLNLLQDHSGVSLEDFYIKVPFKENKAIPYPFWAVQLSAGNNKVIYKNWPVNYFVAFLSMLSRQYSEKNIVLLGDKNETEIANEIIKKSGSNVISFAGKTNIFEVMEILEQSELFIGLDGGLMHLAVALKKPTFTIWGPSSSILYGYEKFGFMHKCVSLNLACAPCSAWIDANHVKATCPELCPDHACMQQLLPQEVFRQFKEYVNLLPIHVS